MTVQVAPSERPLPEKSSPESPCPPTIDPRSLCQRVDATSKKALNGSTAFSNKGSRSDLLMADRMKPPGSLSKEQRQRMRRKAPFQSPPYTRAYQFRKPVQFPMETGA